MTAKAKKWSLDPGDIVSVRWLDSGAGDRAAPAADRPVHLHVCTTHGRVLSYADDDRLDLPKGWCRKTLLVVMCGYGDKDVTSDVAAIWGPAIVSVRNHGKDEDDD